MPVPRLYRRLEKFAQRSRPRDPQTDRLFLSLRRRPGGSYEPLTPSGVAQLLQSLTELAGIRKRVYPHLFRHSFATEMLRRGMNPVQLKEILGHSDLTMISNVYSHLEPQDAYDAMAKALLADDGHQRR